eukprot:7384493-Prymnesium_polylepis.3
MLKTAPLRDRSERSPGPRAASSADPRSGFAPSEAIQRPQAAYPVRRGRGLSVTLEHIAYAQHAHYSLSSLTNKAAQQCPHSLPSYLLDTSLIDEIGIGHVGAVPSKNAVYGSDLRLRQAAYVSLVRVLLECVLHFSSFRFASSACVRQRRRSAGRRRLASFFVVPA